MRRGVVVGVALLGVVAARCGGHSPVAPRADGSADGGDAAPDQSVDASDDGAVGEDRPAVTPTGTAGGTANPFTGTAGSSGAVGGSLDGPNCGGQTYDTQNVVPDLLILLDRSGSMTQQADGQSCPDMGVPCPTQKWPQMVAGLNQVVAATQDKINWGLKYFPNVGACGVNEGAAVPVAAKNATAIMASLAITAPNGNTPTRAAVAAGTTYLRGVADANPKYILLATDGLPNCSPTGNNSTPDDGPAAEAILAAAAAGIPVFVVGIGTIPDALSTLNTFAINGGRPRAGALRYYQVDSTADLVSVLSMIQGQIASCTFGLASEPPVPGNIGVYADGAKLPQSAVDGWSYGPDMKSIVLNGPACDKVKAKQITNVTTYFGCPGETLP